MTKYKTKEMTIDVRQSPIIYPSSSSRSSRLQSYRSTITPTTSRSHHYPSLSSSSSSTTTTLQRRLSSASSNVSPFKSPSLSSSPQTEIIYTRSYTSDRSRPESISSFGRKTEFSSSFEKFFKNGDYSMNASAADSPSTTRRWSRVSDQMDIDDEEGLQEFTKFLSLKPELKSYKSQKRLSDFRKIQKAHDTLSESINQVYLKLSNEPQPENSLDNLLKSANLPMISSPRQIQKTILKNRQQLNQDQILLDEDDSLVFKMSELNEDIKDTENMMPSFYHNMDKHQKKNMKIFTLSDSTNH